jgi:hypothetical protein
MLTSEFKSKFLPILKNKVTVKEYNSKGYSKKHGNISAHKDEYNLDVFNYIDLEGEVFHVAYPYEVELTKEGRNGLYGIIKGSFIKPIDLEYLKPFMDFQELESPVQELVVTRTPTYVSENSTKDSTTSTNNSGGELLQIAQSIGNLLEYKNKKYGNSALAPLDVFKGKCTVGDTIDHKLARVKNSQVLSKNDVTDTIGYLILVCKEMGWETFDEFKD